MSWVAVLLGWIGGAAVNILADSLPHGRHLRRPSCPGCGAPRPVRSWLALAGLVTGDWRCAYCGRPGRGRQVLVELAAAGGAYLLYRYNLGPSGPWMAILVAWVFLVVVVIDFEHRLIPHAVTLPAALVLGMVSSLDPSRGPVKTLAGGAAGFLIVLALYLLGELFARWIARRRGQPLEEVAFGFGDVTLSGVIGLVVGWPGVIVALFVGVLAAGAFSLTVLIVQLLRRRYSPYMPFPYGPFLVLGALLVYLGGRGLFSGLGGT